MTRFCSFFLILFILSPFAATTQNLKFSDVGRENTRDINFEIIGKLNGKILVYKNVWSNHKIIMYDNDMNTVKTVHLDFIPYKTFNIDFVAYQDFFYMIYQYQKKSTVYCWAVKMSADVEKISEPVEIDSTRIPVMTNNKIYSAISSEDKQKILVFKIQTRNQKFDLSTLLFDKEFKLISKNRNVTDFNERRENYNNFLLANDGTLVFTYEKQSGMRDNSNVLALITNAPKQNSFTFQNIELDEKYIDNVELKIDNLNNRYIINTFYYKKNLGSIDGLFTYIWDNSNSKTFASQFIEFNDSLRDEAKRSGPLRFAFDNFLIRQVFVKKDGGFILTAEDFSTETRGGANSWNRYDYLYNPYSSSSGYYYYNPYSGYYRPLSSYNNQTSRYYSENILVLSVSKDGKAEWSRVIQKNQFDDGEDNFLSFSTLITSGEIHFLFNNDRKNQIITDQSITPDGTIKRNPTLKSQERGYEFMPALSKQVGASQLIIPCAYRGSLCFAKIDF